jgi:hypothetical protein
MSFLNGATLCLNFKPATAKQVRAIEHARRMALKRAASPSRKMVRDALAQWRQAAGYPSDAPVYPAGWDAFDLTAQVAHCKALAGAA